MRDLIQLQCSDCKRRNYSTAKSKKNTPDKLERKKYCPWCRHHTIHREVK
ncbi:50S ribosomal protein L33 [bacterium]|jgi:large subunit ribosomal protein L33|nr:50S ribosomal protein L33 [bacterium]MCI0615365.1 50S ribosomal protein L33 [bacterium]